MNTNLILVLILAVLPALGAVACTMWLCDWATRQDISQRDEWD